MIVNLISFIMKNFHAIIGLPLLLLGSFAYGQTESVNSSVSNLPIQDSAIIEKPSIIIEKPIQDDNLRDVPWFVERFRVAVGFYEMFNNTDVQISRTSTNNGTAIDFERDLGFDKSNNSFLGDIEWRISSRSRINFTFYNNVRSTDKTLDREINIGDETYDINTNVHAFIKSNLFRLSYGYAILSKPKYEVGLLLGTHTIATKMGISVNGENVNAERNKDYNLTAPLLDLGIWGGYAFTDRFALRGEINYFQLQIDTFDGRTLGYNLTAYYRVWKKLDIGLGFAGLNFDVNYENTDRQLAYDIGWGYNGMTLVAVYSFGNKKWK
jgi:hypothetical protein